MSRKAATITQERARPTPGGIQLARQTLQGILEGTIKGRHYLDLRTYTADDMDEFLKPFGRTVAGKTGYIYVAGFSEYVKIGWSTDVPSRVYSIEQGLPESLKLFGYFEGTHKDERALHRRFSATRTRGEWFKLSPELQSFIEEISK